MYVDLSYNSEFTELIIHLKAKYGKKFFELDGIGSQLDLNIFSQKFYLNSKTTMADDSADSNANIDTKDIIAYNVELPKPYFRLNAYFLLWKKLRQLYNQEIANTIIEMQLSGDIYINDFHGVQQPYCFNYSTYDIALNGLTMVKKIKSVTPKYLYSFKSQLEQFVVIASNSTLGATGLADLFIVMAKYVDQIFETGHDAGFEFNGYDKTKDIWSDKIYEKNIWRYVKETIVSFIYTINQPMRISQSPFTNVSLFDDTFLESLVGEYKFLDGKIPKVETIKKIQKIFMMVMNDELKRTPVTFPVTTACFNTDENNEIKDEEFLMEVAKQSIEFGFMNFYNGKTSTLSSCCRLRSDTSNEYFNSFGAGSSKIGSLGVVTIGLPRLAYKNKDDEELFLENLSEMVRQVARINNAKRNIIKKRIDNGFLPLYSLGLMELDRQYSTCGLTGINEALEILGYDILKKEGQEFLIKMLDTINNTNDGMQKRYNAPHNCEQVPAENSSIKLAKKDKLMGYDFGVEFYSNQFIPLIINADMLDRIKLQGLFDKHFSGGAILHVNVEEQVTDPQKIVDLIKVCAKMGVVYWALNYNLQKCETGHMLVGTKDTCRICGSKITDNFTRVVGFLTNTKNWAIERRKYDYPKRQWYGGADDAYSSNSI